MEQHELDEATFLLFQRVRVALAIVLIKSTPENMNVESYAAMFQDKFRKHAARINLHLEKKLFREQLLLLLPAFKIASSQECCGEFCEPMEVDAEHETCVSIPQPKLYAWKGEKDEYFSNTINLTSRFLHAVLKAQMLSARSEMIKREDVVELLRSLDQQSFESAAACSSTSNIVAENDGENLSRISNNLLKYVMKSINVPNIIEECISIAVELTRQFLDTFNVRFVDRESVAVVRSMNEILVEYVRNYSGAQQHDVFVVEFVRNSTRALLAKSLHSSTCQCWYMMFGCWRQCDSACAIIINTLFGVIENALSESEFVVNQSSCNLLECNYEHIVELLRRMLSSFSKLHASVSGISSPPKAMLQNDHLEVKRAEAKMAHIYRWEKVMRKIILDCVLKKRPIVRTSWTCLKIIMLMKCQTKNYDFCKPAV